MKDDESKTDTVTTLNGQAEDYMRVAIATNVIESITGGQGQTPLVVTFNDNVNSTASAVQAVLRAVLWGTDSPVEGSRTITVTLTDGDGGTSSLLSKTINVTRTRIAPLVANLPTETYYFLVDQVVRLMPFATISTGRMASFANGNLTVAPTQGSTPNDELKIIHDGMFGTAIGVIGTDVFYGGVKIGTFSGGSGATPLVVTLNANASRASVQSLLGNVGFRTPDTSPVKSSRTWNVTVTLEGVPSVPQTTQMQISYLPEILNFGPSVQYNVNGPAVRLSNTAQLSPSVSNSLVASGSLSFTVTQNGEANDLLSIADQGIGAGNIQVSGANVFFGGLLVGTFTGGTGLTPLVITLNAQATKSSVQGIIKAVTWKSAAATPSLNPRTISVTLTTSSGLQNSPVSKQVLLS